MGMDVPTDFYYYLCGVYDSDQFNYQSVDKHAVEIVDYGAVDDCNFWVVKPATLLMT